MYFSIVKETNSGRTWQVEGKRNYGKGWVELGRNPSRRIRGATIGSCVKNIIKKGERALLAGMLGVSRLAGLQTYSPPDLGKGCVKKTARAQYMVIV